MIFLKIVCIAAILFIVASFPGNHEIDYINFKTFLKYKLEIILLSIFLIFLLVSPRIFFDDQNLYIKKTWRKEMVIPLTSVVSISSYHVRLGTGYTIEYINDDKDPASIRFESKPKNIIEKFINQAKKINPNIKT